jgi:hypothetical protein
MLEILNDERKDKPGVDVASATVVVVTLTDETSVEVGGNELIEDCEVPDVESSASPLPARLARPPTRPPTRPPMTTRTIVTTIHSGRPQSFRFQKIGFFAISLF